MKLTKEQKSLISRAAALGAGERFKRDLAKRLRNKSLREDRVASRYRQRLIDKGLAAAGIDLEEVRTRQKQAYETRNKGYKELAKELQRYAKNVNSRHVEWYRQILRGHPHLPPGPHPNADSWGIINEASAVLINTDQGTPPDGTTSVTPNGNILNFSWNFSDDVVAACELEATFSFFLTPQLAGNLQVIVPVAYNGSCWWNIYGTCFAPRPGGEFDFSPKVTLTVLQDQGLNVTSSSVVAGFGPTISQGASRCLGDQSAQPVDDTQFLESMKIPVIANTPIVISVDVNVISDMWAGRAIVDFATGAQGINVVGILWGIS
jgi:hypothetical protein